jgi:hypothetical protein
VTVFFTPTYLPLFVAGGIRTTVQNRFGYALTQSWRMFSALHCSLHRLSVFTCWRLILTVEHVGNGERLTNSLEAKQLQMFPPLGDELRAQLVNRMRL